MTMSLPQLAHSLNDNSTVIIPDAWRQGRTTYGGLSAAIALQASLAAFADVPPLRSAQIAFVGPLSERVTAKPALLRRGKNSAFVDCSLRSDGAIGLQALFLFMGARPSSIAHMALTMPNEPLDPSALFDVSRLPQNFLRNFDIARGDRAGFADGVARRWVRLRDRAGLHPAVELIAIADALPPAAMSLATQWGPISTTTWQLNLIQDQPETQDGWWLLEAKTDQAAHGHSTQSMTIWNRDGVLIATALQNIAIFV
jgi:acyl-CoA thioesterase